MEDNITHVVISMEVIETLGRYLNGRPHGEVRQLFDMLNTEVSQSIAEQKKDPQK